MVRAKIDHRSGRSNPKAGGMGHDEAMNRTEGHCDEMKWAEVEFETVQGFSVTIEGDTLVARGECPRCCGKTAWLPSGNDGERERRHERNDGVVS
jgi:hypothetical protein